MFSGLPSFQNCAQISCRTMGRGSKSVSKFADRSCQPYAWPELKEALKMPWYKLLCSSSAEQQQQQSQAQQQRQQQQYHLQENRPIPNPELKVVFKMPWDKVLCRIAVAAAAVTAGGRSSHSSSGRSSHSSSGRSSHSSSNSH